MWIGRATRAAAAVAVMAVSPLAFAQTAGSPTAAPRHLDLPIEGVVAPHWTEMPTAEQMAEFYPKLAWSLSLGGRVHLACQQTAIGTLDHCSAVSERPAGLGFGSAAVLLAAYFHTKPDDADDDVSFTILFRMPPTEPVSNVDTANSQPPSKRSLELAHQLVVALENTDQFATMARWCGQTLKYNVDQAGGEEPSTRESTAAVEAFGQACSAQLPAFLDHVAAAYADTYSETELTSILAFMRSPAGKAWTTRNKAVMDEQRHSEQAIWQAVFDDTRKRLCEKIEC